MAHAEKCPVCNGSRRVSEHLYRIDPAVSSFTANNTVLVSCRSCNGRGWVQVNEFPMPIRVDPTVPDGVIRFESKGRIVGEVTVTHDGITHTV